MSLEVVSPLKLYFNWKLISRDHEYWRIFTSLFYKGELSPHTVFDFYICFRYSYMLETDSFRNKPADFIWFICFGCTNFVIWAYMLGIQNLSSSVSTMFLYIWSRKYPNIVMSFLDIFHFRSCFLPLFILLMILLSGFDPTLDLLGNITGHVYFFLEDVVPRLPETRDYRIVKAPAPLKYICDLLQVHDFRGPLFDEAAWAQENQNEEVMDDNIPQEQFNDPLDEQ